MSETGSKAAKTIDDAYNEAMAKYAHREDITGIDIGYKYSNGEVTDTLSVRLHIKEKKAKSALEAVDLFPDEIDSFPVDVIQAKYEPSGYGDAPPETSRMKAIRRTGRCPVMQPGISVAHKKGTAGTLGMFVKDNHTGSPAILSNWHVLAGLKASPGDHVVQPGPSDGGRDKRDTVAELERSILGRDGDAAIALLTNSRQFDPEIAGLNIIADRVEDPEVGDIVVKSGRTTGVTQGCVTGKGRYFIRYHKSMKRIGIEGFIVRPLDRLNIRNEEISRGGDSGSVWLKKDSKAAVGLHFAGETDTRPSKEHALVCYAKRVFSRLDIQPWVDERSVESVQTDADLSQLSAQAGSAATMNYKTIKYETIEKGIMHLTLNRPESYNAINHLMMEELEDFWKERLYDLETVLVILSGAGEKGFCAGLDMKETMETAPKMSPAEFYRFQARLARLNLHMRRAPQPIITAVHGAAAGQGFSFVLSSDIRVISPDAKFNAAYINIGLGGADMSCSYLLPRMIGAGRAYEFMYTGNFMSAEEAMSLGLISKIVEKDKLFDTALEYAKILMTKNHMGLRLTKEAINMNIDAGSMEQALSIEDRNQTLLAIGTFGNTEPLS